MEGINNNVDGPTSIFIAGELGVDWINLFGLIIIVIILIPNIIYGLKHKEVQKQYKNNVINILEQIGRYASMFLMVFNIGLFEFGFHSLFAFGVYTLGNLVLLVAYLICWIPYCKKRTLWNGMALAIIPTCIFLLSGITLRHYLLVASAILFGIGHITITYMTHVETES